MLETKISDDLKAALKGGDKIKVSVLRMFISDLKNRKIADKVKDLDDETVSAVMKKMAKRYTDSIDQFKQAGRDDLVEKETSELQVLKEYLPESIPKEELSGIVNEVIKEMGTVSQKDMGTVIKNVLSRVGGRADGKDVSRIVKEKLS